MRTNDLVKAILKIVELRGLEPLTFSLRRLGRPVQDRPHALNGVHLMHWTRCGQPAGHAGGKHRRVLGAVSTLSVRSHRVRRTPRIGLSAQK